MTSVAPAHRAVPQMTRTPDPTADPSPPTAASTVEAAPARSKLRDQIAENPLLSLFGALMTLGGTAVMALLLFTLTSIGNRIDGVEMSLGNRIDGVEMSLGDRIDGVEVRLSERIDRVEVRLSERIDRLEDKVDTGFAVQGAQIGELDRKLTALIAHLNATEAVEAALEHRLLMPGAGTTEPEGESPG